MTDQATATMPIDVWADFVCPWCFLGKRRLERAIDLTGLGPLVSVAWHPFQLSPDAPRFGEPGAGQSTEEHLAEKYGMTAERAQQTQEQMTALATEDGLAYRLDLAHHVNTFDAHRLALEAGANGVGDEMVELLFAAQLCEGRRIDDPETLVELANQGGLGTAEAKALLAGDARAEEVESEVYTGHRLGATGVPFFVIDRRYGVSGAQPAETLATALKRAHDERTDEPATEHDAGEG